MILKCLKTQNTQKFCHTQRKALKENKKQYFFDTTHKLYMTGYFLLYFNYFVDTSQGTVAMSWFSGW